MGSSFPQEVWDMMRRLQLSRHEVCGQGAKHVFRVTALDFTQGSFPSKVRSSINRGTHPADGPCPGR